MGNTNYPSRDEILLKRDAALVNGEFTPYFQPQYNHSTGLLVGAEALSRWNWPDYGLVSPVAFISIFEEDGFISKMDLAVFEYVCSFIRSSIDDGINPVPISVNISREDLLIEDFALQLNAIRERIGIVPEYVRFEITESSAAGNPEHLQKFISQMHELGYKVEMDDFGSGTSSLNVLKDIDFDVIKLDMAFLRGDMTDGRGGVIVASVLRMAEWLGLPVIAEGVETVEQADFMKSMGCEYVQGYLYSHPIPAARYRELLSGGKTGAIVPQMKLIESMDVRKFWSPESLETLIFSNFVGGAAIFEYREGKGEILRVNQKYITEFGMNMTERELVGSDPLECLDEENLACMKETLERAIATGEEQECETWHNIVSQCCGKDRLCIRSTVRVIGEGPVSNLFYVMVRNVTSEKNRLNAILDNERRTKMACEQANIYYWEYTVATREMRPCFRCMRDLGLPALVTNYPEPAIEMGIFPPEVADMYRDWHHQIHSGVPCLEAVIPLTVGRVPFLVRYTTEFNETGQPIKAYGSATLVVDPAAES